MAALLPEVVPAPAGMSREGSARLGHPAYVPQIRATSVDHAYSDPERAARQLGNTRAVAKAHYIDVPETVPDNRDVLERWARGDEGEV
ncbi:hypothetical protein ACRS6B_26335 [Nocardia asteroides]